MDESLYLIGKFKFFNQSAFEKIAIYFDIEQSIWAIVGKTTSGCFLDYHHSFNEAEFIHFIEQLRAKFDQYEILQI